jgi:hypothetical protein
MHSDILPIKRTDAADALISDDIIYEDSFCVIVRSSSIDVVPEVNVDIAVIQYENPTKNKDSNAKISMKLLRRIPTCLCCNDDYIDYQIICINRN